MQGEEPLRASVEWAISSGPQTLRLSRVPLLLVVFSVGLLLFLAVQPTQPWILLLVTGLVTLSADGVLREHPAGDFRGDIAGTAPFLFLPALLTLGAGLFLDDSLHGFWIWPRVLRATLLICSV